MSILRKSLGENLAEQGVISISQLRQAQAEEKRSGCHLREALVKLGFITEKELVNFISSKMGVLKIELSNYIIEPNIIKIIPAELALKYEVIPLLKIGDRLTCAMADPWNVFALDELKSHTGFIIEPAVVTSTEIKDALKKYY
ncbi:type II secretion system protein GspE, partial [bacterium]